MGLILSSNKWTYECVQISNGYFLYNDHAKIGLKWSVLSFDLPHQTYKRGCHRDNFK